MPLQLSIRADLRALTRDLDRLRQRQVPFATALTLTSVAHKGVGALVERLPRIFDRPVPYTQSAFGVIGARKANLTATIFVKDRQAAYLAPYITGSGSQVLGAKQAVLKPVDQPVNAYGNLPRNKLASLKGRPDIFVGQVKTKGGEEIGGVWQRVTVTRTGRVRRRGAGRRGRIYTPELGRLRLLIRFTDPVEVGSKHVFPYETIVSNAVRKHLTPEWERCFAKAMDTAR